MDTSLSIATRGERGEGMAALRRHHGHERRTERREERREDRRDDRHEALSQLKLKIEQTLGGLTPAPASAADVPDVPDESTAPSSEFEVELRAQIHVSGPNGSVDAKFKLSLETSSDAAGNGDFAGALQVRGEGVIVDEELLHLRK